MDYINVVWLAVSALTTALSAFFGVRIAVARLETRLQALDDQLVMLHERITRLERPFFEK